jgi:hypothetical protein
VIEIALYFLGYTLGLALQTVVFLLVCGAIFYTFRACQYALAWLVMSAADFSMWRENFHR